MKFSKKSSSFTFKAKLEPMIVFHIISANKKSSARIPGM